MAALEDLGLRPHRREQVVRSVAPAWSVWGSPVFHWALVAFILVILFGNLQRSSGLMGVAVGQTKPDAPVSYGVLQAGPLRDWSAVHRSFRVDSFDPDFHVGALDYGPAPTVSVLDNVGHLIKTQRVYPNMPLQTGSLTVHAPADGLAVTISIVDTAGVEVARGVQLVDFATGAAAETTSAGYLVVSDPAGNPELEIFATVPLDRSGGQYVQALPSAPTARLTIRTSGGRTVLDRVVKPGDEVPLPTGGSLRLVGVEWYARLSIVNDWTVPYMYAVLIVALIGLAIAVFGRQQYVVAAVVEGPEGPRLALSIRLWRNAATTRQSIVSALTEALGKPDGAEEGRDS
jgi:cytochrome c biogenesis protein ResB